VSQLDSAREAALVEQTYVALMDGRDEELSSLLINLYLHGQTVASLADRFLCAAMRRVGDLWHRGEITVAQEHVATRAALNALGSLEAVTHIDREGRRLALCCSVEEDFHYLPLRLAALTLAAEGFEVLNIGMSTPFSALTESLERFQPHLICVSSTVLINLDRAAHEYAGFHRAARRRRARLVLGGAGFADAGVRGRFPADLHAESFRQLEEFVATLETSEL
jgi:methanogenic corrinoid protein MtbC1